MPYCPRSADNHLYGVLRHLELAFLLLAVKAIRELGHLFKAGYSGRHRWEKQAISCLLHSSPEV